MSENLSSKQTRAINALLSEPGFGRAAGKVGVTERTLRRWMQEPHFLLAYREASTGAIKHTVGRLQSASGDAVTVLQIVMRDAKNPPIVRLNAAKAVIEFALKGLDHDELQRRIEVLERTIGLLGEEARGK
jgi:hypothetical protein